MDYLADPSQAVFVPGRMLTDNKILCHELVKGYRIKDISPRCMIKIDMQKAYDSLEWHFLEKMLKGLQLPSKFITWIMQCVTKMPYAIKVNESPSAPFKVKKRGQTG